MWINLFFKMLVEICLFAILHCQPFFANCRWRSIHLHIVAEGHRENFSFRGGSLFTFCCCGSICLQVVVGNLFHCNSTMWIIVFAKCWWRSFFLQIVVQDDLQLLVWDDFLTNWHKGSLVRNFCCKHFLQIAEVDHYFLKIVIGDHLLQLFSIIFSQRGWESPLCKLLLGIIFPNCGSLFATWCPRSICLQMFVEDPYLCKVLLWMRSLQFFVVEIFWKRRVVFLQCTNGDYYQY